MYLKKPLLLSLTSLARFNSKWALAFLIAFLHTLITSQVAFPCFHLMLSPSCVWVLTGVIKEKNRPWICASTVRQQTKHWCVTSAVLVTNLKPSTLQAAVKKITLPANHTWYSRWKMFVRFCLPKSYSSNLSLHCQFILFLCMNNKWHLQNALFCMAHQSGFNNHVL